MCPPWQWRHTSVSTHHLQQFAVYLSFTFRLHSAVRSSGRRGADDTVLHQLSSGGGAEEGIQHSSPTVIINQERRRGHLCSTLSRATQHFRFSFQECLSKATRIKRAVSMGPMQQWVGGPCCLQSSAGQGQDLLHSSESWQRQFLQPPGNQNPDK